MNNGTFDYLKPEKLKADVSIYYLKFIKSTTLGDPLFQQMGIPQKKISEFVDFHLRPHVEALPSHLKDTTDYLLKWNP